MMDNKWLKTEVELSDGYLDSIRKKYGVNGDQLPPDMSQMFQEYEKLHKQLEDLGVLRPLSLRWTGIAAAHGSSYAGGYAGGYLGGLSMATSGPMTQTHRGKMITTSAVPYARKTIAMKGSKMMMKKIRPREKITPRSSRDFRHLVLEAKRTRRLLSRMQDTVANFSLNMSEHFTQYAHDSENDSLHSDNFDTDDDTDGEEEDTQ